MQKLVKTGKTRKAGKTEWLQMLENWWKPGNTGNWNLRLSWKLELDLETGIQTGQDWSWHYNYVQLKLDLYWIRLRLNLHWKCIDIGKTGIWNRIDIRTGLGSDTTGTDIETG